MVKETLARGRVIKHIHHKGQQAGFTLVELSIVLVIIGLIVGGVLAGGDMVKAAQIRATVSQPEKFNTAVNTFRDKFGAMPGDVGAILATKFGMNSATVALRTTLGGIDQDGVIECNTAACGGTRDFGSETAMFWNDLSWAVVISESLQLTTPAAGNGGAAVTADLVRTVLPEARIGQNNFFAVFSAGSRNYYQLAGISAISAAGVYTLENRLTPQEAFNIDAKMDDGRPTTGSVRSLSTIASTASLNGNVATFAVPNNATAAGAAPLGCVITGTLEYQTTTADDRNTPACMLRIAFN